MAVRNREQLTDVYITAAQTLIQKEFPHLDGLQSPLLRQEDQLLAMVDEGVQIHHIDMTSTSISGKITIYDSLYSYKLTTPLCCHQLSFLYKLLVITEDGEIKSRPSRHLVNVPNIKQQNGTKDCGVFTIAYTYHAYNVSCKYNTRRR